MTDDTTTVELAQPQPDLNATSSLTLRLTSATTSLRRLVGSIDADTPEKLIGAIFMLCISAIVIILPYSFPSLNLNIYQLISILIIGLFIRWFVHLFFILITSNNIHFIAVINRQIEGFGINSFPVEIKHDRDRCIMSISEFAGKRGTSAYYQKTTTMIGNVGLIVSAILIKYNTLIEEHVHSKMNEENIGLNPILVLVFLFCCICGMILIVSFEVNNYDLKHSIVHHIGCVLLVFMGPALMIELKYIVYSVVLFVVFAIAWIVYFIAIGCCFKRKYVNDPVKVNRVSKICIFLEFVAWIMLAVGLVSIVWNLDSV